ncbi:membrane protein [Streptomyces subrutilus]|uniref:Endolytic murein transglycosylase n=1 Tax=Streptomyces subrutilus TaxID=36818 RepID=A0A5P2UVB8_9ACTN|nr:endolytic transglycosylase MltG [Streptomyces subrutilus]QEU81464.1 endolytic transglycosylase MltG [Streptomyces subrutilus]GGZ94597.1 membrane protein [Streptomyces subrutilus]
MTEYGRGRGPEPWHPEDPLYGDQGWTGHPTQQGQVPYAGAQQAYPQEPQYQDPQQYQQDPAYAQAPQQGYPQEPQYQDPSYPQEYQQHPEPQQYPVEPGFDDRRYAAPQYAQAQQGYAPAQQAPQQAQPQQPVYDSQGWDTGQGQYVAAAAQADAYAGVDPYAQQPVNGYPGETPDLYTTAEAYPPPQPPGRRHLEPDPAEEPQGSDLLTEERDPADGGGDDGNGTGGRRGGRAKGDKPKRSGAACLVASLVIVTVLGGGGYYGYTYLKDRFAAAEDYAGSGTDETVDVEIPKGSGLGQMGRILKKAGVVASAQAFVDAANANPKGKSIQPGIYPLKKRMSAASVVELMTDPTKLQVLTVTEGMRNAAVYEAIDRKLGKSVGTTQEIAKREVKNLGLPAWANNDPRLMDPLEGFLLPMRYDLSKDSSPESLLKEMVKNATDKYAELGIEGKAKSLGLENPLQVITVASLVNAEGKNHDDFRKMAEVVYNRLKKTNDVTNQKIEFDSTYNYIKGQSEINFNLKEARKFDHPYNTHFVKGLPPGPIGNPGTDALTATLNPDHGGWMFFVSVDGDKTSFTQTYDEHLKLVEEFQERQKQKNGG